MSIAILYPSTPSSSVLLSTANIKISGNSGSDAYPYAHNIYFETPNTAITKLNFLKSVGAQGVIIWDLSNEIWQEGMSITKALYENSGNPAKEPIFKPRPFYIIGHNPNTIDEVKTALDAGANAIEPDLQRDIEGRIVVYHDDINLGAVHPILFEEYLKQLIQLPKYSQISLITLDCKPRIAAKVQYGEEILTLIRKYLKTDSDPLSPIVIISAANIKDTNLFETIGAKLSPREGIMFDSENDPETVTNTLVEKGTQNIAFGNGTLGANLSGIGPNVLSSIELATWQHAKFYNPKFTYAYTIEFENVMNEFIQTGVDGIITDKPNRLLSVVKSRRDVRLATRSDNPFTSSYNAYALRVKTSDQINAGTDANVTFTLIGSAGQASVIVDTYRIGRMEQGSVNYVTLQSSFSLGELQSITVTRDNKGIAPDWHLDEIRVTSYQWLGKGVEKTATFNSWIPTSGVAIALE